MLVAFWTRMFCAKFERLPSHPALCRQCTEGAIGSASVQQLYTKCHLIVWAGGRVTLQSLWRGGFPELLRLVKVDKSKTVTGTVFQVH